jgi:hypothetical protein
MIADCYFAKIPTKVVNDQPSNDLLNFDNLVDVKEND